ncbi:GAF domain protein [Hydrogenophaga sp. RAC07]|nr:GAF domain protein [Hydrogenophaga sp. RAC07]
MESEMDTLPTERIGHALVDLLHRSASSAEFAARLAQAQAWPDETPDKHEQIELVHKAMAIHDRLDVRQQREIGMLAVIESARDLSSRLDLPETLSLVVSRAKRLLGSQVAWLSAYDASLDGFHVLTSDGALSHGTGNMLAGRGLGIVSVVVKTRLPFTTADYLHDTRFPHDPQLDATFRDEGIAAVVGVPLLWEDEVIGLLFVADRFHRTHTAQNISILSTLATHAAVAIKNAMAFEQANAALRSAEAAHAALEHHVRNVQAAAEAHDRMTSLLAKGATLATICQSVTQFLEGSVLVLDEAGQVIARASTDGYGGTAAATYEPHGQRSDETLLAIGNSRRIGRSVLAFEAHGESCRVNAVIGGNDVLGAMLLFRQEPLDDMAIRTFERSATIVGIVLLSRERADATQRRDLSSLLRDLLSPRQDDLALLCERAERFGLDLMRPTSMLLLETHAHDAGYVVRRLRATQLLPNTLFDEINGVLTILCATTQADDVRRSLEELARQSFGVGYRGVISRPIPQPAELPTLHASLRRALPVLARIGIQGHVVAQNELALYSTLFETHDQASLSAFLEATIGTLASYDQKRGSELISTLLEYFNSNQNAKLTAERLGIHVNTVRQRLTTIEGLIGHWGNALRSLEIHVALRLWVLSKGA